MISELIKARPSHDAITRELQTRLLDGLSASVGVGDLVRLHSPYRVCPLGAHVDHQYGSVLACAIPFGTDLLALPCKDEVQGLSCNFSPEVHIRLADAAALTPQRDWADHLRGAVWALQRKYSLVSGMRVVSRGEFYQAGLSSSASISLAYVSALADINGLTISINEKIRLACDVEQGFMGLRNGALDPAAIAKASAGQLTCIDTRSLEHSYCGFSDEVTFLAFFSGMRKALTPENFNTRVDESRAAAAQLKVLANARAGDSSALQSSVVLGDVPVDIYETHRDQLSAVHQRRADHFFSEVARVEQAAQACEVGDWSQLGALMAASSLSSINNYECGAGPVKDLVTILNELPNVLGARFCGPGFRGCSVALVKTADIEEVVEQCHTRYQACQPELASSMWVLPCQPADGVQALSMNGAGSEAVR